MLQIALFIAFLIGLLWTLNRYRKSDRRQRRAFWWRFAFALIFIGVLWLTFTGRLHFIAAIATALFGLLVKLSGFVKYWPILRRFSDLKNDQAENSAAEGNLSQMSREEALAILGLDEGASDEQIIQAHRSLIQKLHPDRGGNDFLAAQLNAAKDLLLGPNA